MKLGKKSCSGQSELLAQVKFETGDEVYFLRTLPSSPESLQNFSPEVGSVNAVILYSTAIFYRIEVSGRMVEVPSKFVANTKAELLDAFYEDIQNRWYSNYMYKKEQLEKEEK